MYSTLRNYSVLRNTSGLTMCFGRRLLPLAVVATTVLAPLVAHAASPSLYATATVPVYQCVSGDNSIQINGLLANGGDVEIGAGTCSLTHGLVMLVSGTTLNGAGAGQTILRAAHPLSMDIVTIGSVNASYSLNSFTLSNLTTDGGLLVNAGKAKGTGRGLVIAANVHADQNHPSGAAITNVEMRFGFGGATISGSNITATNINIHGNRHIGVYVSGNTNMPTPYNYSDSVAIKGSRADGNNLDNVSGGVIYDTIDFDRLSSRGVFGGPNSGDGNEVSGGDVLLSCDQLGPSGCAAPVGPFLVQGNTITDSAVGGIRVFGEVSGAVVTGNTLERDQGTAISVVGSVYNLSVDHNVISDPIASGVHVFPLSGTPMGNSIVVASNVVTMGNLHKPAFLVSGATNVTLSTNNGNGASYDTSAAGSGLVMTANQ